MQIVILGAGAWGTALATSACRNPVAHHQVSLWARDHDQVLAIRRERVNQRYLPGVTLPDELVVRQWPVASAANSADAHGAATQMAGLDLVVIATPMAALRETLQQLRGCAVPVVWLCKGFEEAQPGTAQSASQSHGLLAHEVLEQTAPGLQAGVLSGPSFAQEVARGQPTAVVAASSAAAVRAALVQAFHSPSLRV